MLVQTKDESDISSCGNPQCSCRFGFCDQKLAANAKVRQSFITPEQANGGIAIGTLGVSDVEFYLSRGFDPEQIITVESDEDNHRCLKSRLSPYKGVRVLKADLYQTLLNLDRDCVSSVFFDLYGLRQWDPFLVRHSKELKLILRKDVSVQVTYPTGRSCVSGFRARRDDRSGQVKIRSSKLAPPDWFFRYLSEISEANTVVDVPSVVEYEGISSLRRRVAMETFCVSRTTRPIQEYTKGYIIYDSSKEGKGLRAVR